MKISLKNLQNLPICFKAKERKKKKNLQLIKHWVCPIAKFKLIQF